MSKIIKELINPSLFCYKSDKLKRKKVIRQEEKEAS